MNMTQTNQKVLTRYLYDRFELTDEYKAEIVEFVKHQTNAEIGGYKLYDGIGTHLMQNPYEVADFIFALKEHEELTKKKLSRFLEIGFSAGINNTLLNKFMKFDEVIGVDTFSAYVNGSSLKANLMHKNLTLICGDSTSQRVIRLVEKLGPYDLIFIDGCHEYEFVKKDFFNFKNFLNDWGVIAFHDVDCPDWPGINRFWNELKATREYNQTEFVCRDYLLRYGIGLLKPKRS